ncbi:DUF1801 domain-containing protein [Chloroflexota bacterium]
MRRVILENLPAGYEEAMNWGMITYQVPLSVYPDTYNGQPLMYAALASQKNHMAVYLMAIYMNDEARQRFEEGYRLTGKHMDVGRSCVRFRKLEDLPLDLIAGAVSYMGMQEFVRRERELRQARSRWSRTPQRKEGTRGLPDAFGATTVSTSRVSTCRTCPGSPQGTRES